MSEYLPQLGLAAFFSILVGSIQVTREAKASGGACATSAFAVYLTMLLIGNLATTFVATDAVTSEAIKSKLLGPVWFWAAFVGVFGFEAILRNMNVTLFGKGVLSIEDWISKAKEVAVAAGVKREAIADNARTLAIAARLQKSPNLNTFVIQFLGPGAVTELERMAKAESADPALLKALAFARDYPIQAAAAAK